MEKVAGIEKADGMEKIGGTAGGTTIITAIMPCVSTSIDLRSIFRDVGMDRIYRVQQ